LKSSWVTKIRSRDLLRPRLAGGVGRNSDSGLNTEPTVSARSAAAAIAAMLLFGSSARAQADFRNFFHTLISDDAAPGNEIIIQPGWVRSVSGSNVSFSRSIEKHLSGNFSPQIADSVGDTSRERRSAPGLNLRVQIERGLVELAQDRNVIKRSPALCEALPATLIALACPLPRRGSDGANPRDPYCSAQNAADANRGRLGSCRKVSKPPTTSLARLGPNGGARQPCTDHGAAMLPPGGKPSRPPAPKPLCS